MMQKLIPYRRVTLVWILLLAATFASWRIGNAPALMQRLNVGTAVIAIAFFKIRLVVLQFMEIRDAPGWMRLACEAWVVGVGTAVVLLARYHL